MGKDKIKPEKLGELFFGIYKGTVSINNRILKSLKNIDGQIKLPPDEHIMAELDYLHIYALYRAFLSRFKSYFDIFLKSFIVEYKNYLREMMPEESAEEYEMNLLSAHRGYMDRHNAKIAESNNTEAQIEFGRYISHRVIGDQSGDDIRYVIMLYTSYSSDVIELLRIIDMSIEILNEEF